MRWIPAVGWCGLALAGGAASSVAQAVPERPRPYPVFETRGFTHAVEAGTRTRTGRPGPRYWQQYARYRLAATLDPAARRLTGRGTIVYLNRSTDTLRTFTLNLYQDLYAPNGLRNDVVEPTDGMELTRVVVQGRQLLPDSGAARAIRRRGTVLVLPAVAGSVAPGDSATLEFEWAFTVPHEGGRMGHDGEVFYFAYWYPQLAVYDDVNGWVRYPHMGQAEFYMGYADYDVAITVPDGWLVAATGTLTNPADVLTRQTRDRLARARRGAVVHVVTAEDRSPGVATARGARGAVTWRFQAGNVRDFAFGTSDRYVWDATIAVAGDADGDGRPDTSTVHALYRPDRDAWHHAARYGRFSVEFLSRFLWPYPYPHMTAVEGLRSCGGMEYPMMTCIGGAGRDTASLFGTTLHEIGHMWFPMIVGANEQAHAWQDEGLTSYNTSQGAREFYGRTDDLSLFQGYLGWARVGEEVELMRHGEQYPIGTPAYAVASYAKMASILRMLRGLVGAETFLRAYREYGRRWANKHPTPYDFWNTFNDVTGRDLSWFWRTWFYETWTLDQALGSVTPAGDGLDVVVEDRGLAPMPARVAVTRSDGTVERLEVPVEVWLGGARRHTLRVAHAATVTGIAIDPDQLFADVDRTNQTWSRE